MPRYECDCCGACCQGHLIVEAYEIDVLQEPRLIAADPHCKGRSVEQAMEDLADGTRCLVLGAGRPCALLGTDCRCTTYPTRPSACVAMQAGSEECQYARAAAGLPPLEPTDPAIIRVERGQVCGCFGLPPGSQVEERDYDVDSADPDDLSSDDEGQMSLPYRV